MTRQAVETGLRANPPVDRSDEALHGAVTDALREIRPLADVMNAIVRYSPTVQDVSVTDAHGMTLVSTDPDALNQPAPFRFSLASVRDGGMAHQMQGGVRQATRAGYHRSRWTRNGMPFLVVHVGVRSTFLKNSYEPWLRDGVVVCAGCGAGGDDGGGAAGQCCAAAAGDDQCAAGEPDAGRRAVGERARRRSCRRAGREAMLWCG